MLLLAVAAYALISVSRSPLPILVGFCLANIGIYAGMAVFWTIPQTYLPRDIAAAGIGTISATGSAAGFAVTSLIGHLQDSTHSLTSGFSVVIVVLLLSSASLLLIARRLRRTPTRAGVERMAQH